MAIPAVETPSGDRLDAGDHWARVESLTQAMLAAAEGADIDRLTALERERRGLLEALFGAGGTRPAEAAIHRLLAQDAVIARHATTLREELMNRLSGITSTRKAVAAYGHHRE